MVMETQVKTQPARKVKRTGSPLITPFLWFDTQAEEAANFYLSVFNNSRVTRTTRYNADSAAATGIPEGTAMTVEFHLEGQVFTALNGGPAFKISPAISFMVNCYTGEEVERLWEKLSPGGQVFMEIGKYPFSDRYGWIQDKFGVSWQLVQTKDEKIIAPCLLFSGDKRGKAEEAINFYTSVFDNSGIERIERYTAGEQGPTGAIKYSSFTLSGQKFRAMDSGVEVPFDFNPALSFLVNCEKQEEIDYYWDVLSKYGNEAAQQCGWLMDRYGVSWQVVPVILSVLLTDPDQERSGRAMRAMLKMKKIDIAGLL